jgi:cell division protein FtsZ
VVVEPYIPSASHEAIEEHVRVDDVPVPSVYVPSHATRPDGQRRMPRTEELPAVARRSLDATDRQEQEPRNARALFKRLASNVGRNLRPQADEEAAAESYPDADDAAARSAIEAGGARGSRASQASLGAPGQLDQMGRQQATPPSKERLEIPSFLRKHG